MSVENAQTISIPAPEGFKYEQGQPIVLPASAIDFKQFVPKELAEKDYFKKINTAEEFFKSFDGAQALLGKKPAYAVPAADAPQEEWDKYLAASRPEKADDYQFEVDPNVPEPLKASPEFQGKVKAMFHEAGVTPHQAKILQKKWDGMMLEIHKTELAAREKQDNEFAEAMTKTYGEKAPEMVERAKRIFGYILPKEMHAGFSKLSNEQLQLMAVLANTMADKYMEEDEIPKGDGSGGKTVADLQKRGREIMAEMSKLEGMDPKKEKLAKERDEIYQQIAAMQK